MTDNSTSITSPVLLRRSVGLAGATALVVGGVIGMGIFVLVAPAAALAGEALWLAILLALSLSLISALPLIQLASALPRAGGGYFFVSRMFSPYPGALTSNWGVLGGAFSSALVSKGLAAYLVEQFSWPVPTNLVGALILVLLYGVYRLGMRIATQLQVLLVAQLLLALGLYIVYGVGHSGIAVSLSFPQGASGFFMAVVLAYSISMGAQILAEMGEEVRNAQRNIPLALFIGGALILFFYTLVAGVFIRATPYDFEAYQTMQAPLAYSARDFLSPWMITFLSLAAVSAGLTSLNAAMGSLPRELFAQARDGVLPQWFAQIHRGTGSPLNAVTAYSLLAVILTLSPVSIAFCGYMVAVGISMLSILIAVAALRLPERYPQRYQGAFVRFPKALLWTCTLVATVSSAGFIILITLEAPPVLLCYLGWTGAVTIWYVYAKKRLRRKGIDLAEVARHIPGEDAPERRP